ncbi:MAG: hypothetical protein PHD72_00135 [Patescibacteria group bacterium]|nr:hypothetical protein [Patescibacteria group bacterium]
MSWKRRVKYQFDYYRRRALGVFGYAALPDYFTGRTARIVYITILVATSLIYICQTSLAAGSGYEMRDLQNKVNTLQEDIQKIEVEIAENTSMAKLETRLAELNMVAISDIKYISAVETAVAKK